jgi:cell division protein FtsL
MSDGFWVRLRLGRIVVLLAIVVVVYMVVFMRTGENATAELEAQVMVLQNQIEDQKQQIKNLSRFLSGLDGGLHQVREDIDSLARQIAREAQISSHTFANISDNILNMKNKLEILSNQAQPRGYYGR